MKNGGMTFSLNLTIIQHKAGIEIQKEIIYNPPSNTLNEKFSKSVNIFFARANFFSNEAFHKGTSFQNGEALHNVNFSKWWIFFQKMNFSRQQRDASPLWRKCKTPPFPFTRSPPLAMRKSLVITSKSGGIFHISPIQKTLRLRSVLENSVQNYFFFDL